MQEIHKSIAQKRRQQLGTESDAQTMKTSNTDLNVIEINFRQHATSGPAGKALSEELRRLQTNQAMRSLQNLQPIIFEECFVRDMRKLKEKAIK